MKTKNPKVLKKIAIALAIVIVATVIYVYYLQPHTLEVKTRLKLESTQQQLTTARDTIQKQQAQTLQDEKKKQAEIDDLNKQLQDTQKQLQAKAATKAANVAYAAPAPAPQTYSLPSDTAKAFIYDHESGNRPNAINASSGACGLGQALPCSKLPCSLSDYACQDAWFTNYAMQRYGSWANAYAFWQIHHWW